MSAGDEVEVRPGIMMKGDDGNNVVCYPIKLKVVSVLAVRQNSEDEEEDDDDDEKKKKKKGSGWWRCEQVPRLPTGGSIGLKLSSEEEMEARGATCLAIQAAYQMYTTRSRYVRACIVLCLSASCWL